MKAREKPTFCLYRDGIARAIYMAHWELPVESMRGLDHRMCPTWETASKEVREWVLVQADAVLNYFWDQFHKAAMTVEE